MSIECKYDENVLKVLVYNFEKDGKIPAGAKNILNISITGAGTISLLEVHLSDYYGNLLDAKINAQSTLPNTFSLCQNFPNPFNATTTITYELPYASHVKIEVFNILGQSAITLVDDRESPGRHRISWSGTDKAGALVPSGVYIYRMTVAGCMTEKKMVLLK
jgi:hypothetical protein